MIKFTVAMSLLCLITLLAILIGSSPPAFAVETHSGSESQGAHYFGNVELVAHNGEQVRLYDDLIDGKTVVFSSFFSRCQGICPPLNSKLKAISRALGDRVGKDVVIVSISVDPEFDTPERLEEYAKRMGVGEGWLMVSGKPDNVRAALTKLGLATTVKEAHSPVLIIGKDRTGLWKKAHGFAPMNELLTIVRSVVDDGDSQ